MIRRNKGVTWTVSGTGTECNGNACGTVTPTTSASGAGVQYTAPVSRSVSSDGDADSDFGCRSNENGDRNDYRGSYGCADQRRDNAKERRV